MEQGSGGVVCHLGTKETTALEATPSERRKQDTCIPLEHKQICF